MSDIYTESFEFLYNNHSSRSRHRVCLIERARASPTSEEYPKSPRGTSQRRDARLFQNKKTAFDFVTSSTKMFASTKTSFRAANASDDGSRSDPDGERRTERRAWCRSQTRGRETTRGRDETVRGWRRGRRDETTSKVFVFVDYRFVVGGDDGASRESSFWWSLSSSRPERGGEAQGSRVEFRGRVSTPGSNSRALVTPSRTRRTA